MEKSSLYKFVKVIPKTKYLVISSERWDSKFLGIFETELNGSDIYIESDHDLNKCLGYTPLEVTPLLDIELNNIGVKFVLFVSPISDVGDRRVNLTSIKQTEKYISYMRDANIDKVL